MYGSAPGDEGKPEVFHEVVRLLEDATDGRDLTLLCYRTLASYLHLSRCTSGFMLTVSGDEATLEALVHHGERVPRDGAKRLVPLDEFGDVATRTIEEGAPVQFRRSSDIHRSGPLSVLQDDVPFVCIPFISRDRVLGLCGLCLIDHHKALLDAFLEEIQPLTTAVTALLVQHGITGRSASDHEDGFPSSVSRIVMAAIDDGVVVIDPKLQVRFANQSTSALLEIDPEKLKGTTLLDLVHPDAVTACREAVDSALQGMPVFREIRFVTPNGGILEADVRFIPTGQGVASGADPTVLLNIRDASAERLIQQKYDQQRRILQEVSRLTKTGGWVLDVDSGRFTITDEVYALHDMKKGDYPLTMEGVRRFYTEEDWERVEACLRQVMEFQQDADLETNVITMSGRTIQARIIFHPVIVKDKVVRIFGVFSDVTEQRKQSREFQRQQRMLEQMSSLTKTGGWEFDVATGKVTWTDQVYRIHEIDRSVEPSVAMGLRYYPDHAREIVEKCLQQATEDCIESDVETDFITAKGNERRVRIIFNPIVRGDEVTQVTGVFGDVTQQFQARQEADEAKLRTELALDAVGMGIWEWDIENDEIQLDERFAHLYGYTLKELSRQLEDHKIMAHPDDWIAFEHARQQYRNATTSKTITTEVRVRTKDGRWRWTFSRGQVVKFTEEGLPKLAVGIHMDITDRREMENRLNTALMSGGVTLWTRDFDTGELILDGPLTSSLGYDADQIVTTVDWFGSIAHPDDYSGFLSALGRHLSQREQGLFERSLRLRHANDEWRWILLKGRVNEYSQNGRAHIASGTMVDIHERKTIEERLQLALDGGQLVLGEADLRTMELSFDDRWLSMFGDDAPPKSIMEFFSRLHPEDAQRSVDFFRELLSDGDFQINHTFRYLHFDGSYRWILGRGKATAFDEEHTPTNFAGTFLDITDQIESTVKLQESEERLRSTVEAARIGTWDTSIKTGRNVYNEIWATMLGYEPGEIETTVKAFWSLIHPDDVAQAVERYERHIKNPSTPYEIEVRLKTKSGNFKWIQSRGKVVEMDAGGSPVRAIGVHVDIDELKTAYARLEESERRFRDVLESLPAGVLIRDIDGRIIYANEMATNLVGQSVDELLGRDLENLRGMLRDAHDTIIDPKDHLFYEAKDTLKPVEARLLKVRDQRTGEYRVCMVSAIPIFTPEGEFHQVLSVALDINEWYLSATTRQEIEETKEYAAVLGHDINKLLQNLKHQAGAIMRASTTAPTKDLLEFSRQVQNIEGLCQKFILSSSKDMETKVFNIADLARYIGENNRFRLSGRSQLLVEIDPQAEVLVKGDEVGLRSVILNLVTNACEALIGRNGTLRITCRTVQVERDSVFGSRHKEPLMPGEYAVIGVEDTGRGMSEETRKRLFEFGYSTKRDGHGVGMAGVFNMVRRHQGTITFTTEVNKGTRFKVYIPTTREAPSHEVVNAQAGDATMQAIRSRFTILLIDDDETATMVNQRRLGMAGYRVLTASSGAEGVELYRSDPEDIDLVISDAYMPKMDGAQTFYAIREIDPTAKVALWTGQGRAKQSRLCISLLAQGLVEVFEKLASLDEVLLEIDHILIHGRRSGE